MPFPVQKNHNEHDKHRIDPGRQLSRYLIDCINPRRQTSLLQAGSDKREYKADQKKYPTDPDTCHRDPYNRLPVRKIVRISTQLIIHRIALIDRKQHLLIRADKAIIQKPRLCLRIQHMILICHHDVIAPLTLVEHRIFRTLLQNLCTGVIALCTKIRIQISCCRILNTVAQIRRRIFRPE